jgi:hypothetical protein
MTEVKRANCLAYCVADGVGKVERLAIARHAGRTALFLLDFRKLVQ